MLDWFRQQAFQSSGKRAIHMDSLGRCGGRGTLAKWSRVVRIWKGKKKVEDISGVGNTMDL